MKIIYGPIFLTIPSPHALRRTLHCLSCAFWATENSLMFTGARSSLIVDNQVLRGRPLGRFHSLGGARAPSSANRVSVVGARREVWPKRESRRAFSVVLAKGLLSSALHVGIRYKVLPANAKDPSDALALKRIQASVIYCCHGSGLTGVQQQLQICCICGTLQPN